jgi:hypothetical protein
LLAEACPPTLDWPQHLDCEWVFKISKRADIV